MESRLYPEWSVEQEPHRFGHIHIAARRRIGSGRSEKQRRRQPAIPGIEPNGEADGRRSRPEAYVGTRRRSSVAVETLGATLSQDDR